MKHHANLLDPVFWQKIKDRILQGHLFDVFPYDQSKRFVTASCQSELPESM